MNKSVLVILALALFLIIETRNGYGQNSQLPKFAKEDLSSEDQLQQFVNAFLNKDSQAAAVLNPSNQQLFKEGFRPTIGVISDPEIGGKKILDLKTYFVKKFILDIGSVGMNRQKFKGLLDTLTNASGDTLICTGEIAGKYQFKMMGFVWDEEIEKIPAGRIREQFKKCWLNDAILASEVRILGWAYQQLFSLPYVPPSENE